MTLLVPNNGEGDMLAYGLNKSTPQDLVLCLFKNNITPAETDTTATYTEATFTGYAGLTLTGASWTITEGAPSSAAYATQTFTCSSTGTTEQVYGYFTKRATSGRIGWAERFSDGPYPITTTGDNIKVPPTITGD
ncbi:MAG: hypothetical protein JWN23_1554 [Rhodocyclales bacterium]|nr:hypothetical protein [Rhodocyclales bacterium]